MAPRWHSAWITGASSGIGREITLQLARSGVRVAASARSADALANLAAEAPGIAAYPLDVADPSATAATLARITTDTGLPDLAILAAGIWQPMGARAFDAQKCQQSIAVNYLGICHALEVLLPAMRARGTGHVALVSSVAGYRGLPNAAAYAPSKAAVISLAETLRPELTAAGLTLSLVNPGFVDTPMTRVNEFPMPFILTAPDAARRIIRGLEQGKFEIAFPWQLVWMLKAMRVLPYPLYFWITGRMIGAPRSDRA